MNKNNFNKKVDKLLDIIVDTILGAKRKEEAAAVTLWPLPTPQGMLYWSKEWSKKLNHVLHLIDKQNIAKEKIAEAIKFPSRIVHIIWRIDAIKNSDLDKEEKLYTIRKLLDYLAIFRKENLFCEDGKNIIWDLKEMECNKKGLFFFSTVDEKTRKLFFNFEASLFLYTELLYWANHPIGHSFHGPYETSEGIALVKEYFDLKPKVWGFSKNLNFFQVEIFEVYKKATELKLDFFERGIRTIEPFKQNLITFALKVDKKPIKHPEEISKFLKNLMDVIKEGSKLIQSLSEQQLIEKHAEYWFYMLKPLCDLVKEDWRPTKQVRDNIHKKYNEIKSIWENVVKKNFEKTGKLPLEQQEKILRDIFDPRK